MPATAGRVRMPANNRVHSSAALQTHGIWQSAIGYDPYAPNQNNANNNNNNEIAGRENAGATERDGENAYDSFQGLLALARLTGSNNDEARGACKKCGRVGHLTFQCRNFLSVKEDIAFQIIAEKDDNNNLDNNKSVKFGGKNTASMSEDSEEEESSELTDSDEDSAMERIIAQRFGKKSKSGEKKDKHKERPRISSKKHSIRKSKRSRVSDSEDARDDGGDRRGRSRRKKSMKSKRSSRKEYSDDQLEDGHCSELSEEERRRRKEKRKKNKKRRVHCLTESDSDSEEVTRRKRKKRHGKDERSRRRLAETNEDDSESADDRMQCKHDKKYRPLKYN